MLYYQQHSYLVAMICEANNSIIQFTDSDHNELIQVNNLQSKHHETHCLND